jgi:hypothetical protein
MQPGSALCAEVLDPETPRGRSVGSPSDGRQ